MLLELDRITSGYGRSPVLHDVSLSVAAGEIVALIGANGAGKSTLLNTIMGLITASSGAIRFDNAPITHLPTPTIVRTGIAQVPERRQLFGAMSVEENLLMGAYTNTQRRTVTASLEQQFLRFPILRQRRRQLARTLSGGEQQMVALARATMSRPRLLLLDEPSLGLAPMIVARIMQQIAALRGEGGTVSDRRAERARRAGHRRQRLRPGERPHRPRRPSRRPVGKSRRTGSLSRRPRRPLRNRSPHPRKKAGTASPMNHRRTSSNVSPPPLAGGGRGRGPTITE